ncbi:hypothetical protein ACRALDRAFT_2037499 [Sodiomyces alcalophilus JCM 7366]|uniref:uncharacterized protein n=1 Tax=Sodiomyces alcalophilus JCM 7366 TaxID=591952 RepID=UPI0039B38780
MLRGPAYGPSAQRSGTRRRTNLLTANARSAERPKESPDPASGQCGERFQWHKIWVSKLADAARKPSHSRSDSSISPLRYLHLNNPFQ